MAETLEHGVVPELEDPRILVVKADEKTLMQNIRLVPFDEKTGSGGCYEYEDGTPVEPITLVFLASMGAL